MTSSPAPATSSPAPATSSPAPVPVDLDDDDRPIGRVLTRREVLALLGLGSVSVVVAACAPGSVASGIGATASPSNAVGASGTVAAGTATATAVAGSGALPSCVVVPELTEGPYYVDEHLERADIRVDTATGQAVAGATLTIDWVVSQVDGNACVPLGGVLVDVWHCDAAGDYSDVGGEQGHDFLRGYQHTNANGLASITTIYPGWYQGRAVHVHFKVRTDPAATSGFEFTSQLFFDDALSAQVFARDAYAAKGQPDTPNASDGIYQQSQGLTLLDVSKDGDGYKATFELAIKTT